MKSFAKWVEERGIEMPKHNIPGSWFSRHGFPMVVRCACCDMTMALPSAWIDNDEYVLCADCAKVNKEE